MDKIIKIRRGSNSNLPVGGTVTGEPRFSTDTGQLYIDDGTQNVEITPNSSNISFAGGALSSELTTVSASLSLEIDNNITIHASSGDHDNRYYIQSEVDSKWSTWSGTTDHNTIQNTHNLTTDINHNNLTNYIVDEHRTINDGGVDTTDLWSASKISSEIASVSGTIDHSTLDNLAFGDSGHTGFSQDTHLHDDRYYTETEVDIISGSLQTNIDNKPDILLELTDTPSSYDVGKYLRSTVDGTIWVTISGGTGSSNHSELNELAYSESGHTGFAQTSHPHTESDITDLDKYTQAEVDTISGSLSTEIDSDISTHTSNTDAHHAESHTVASHSDTTATGAALDELTDGSETSLHIHDNRYYTESEVDTISGSLQTKINDITVSGGVNTFVDLNDTPASYNGNEDKHVYIESAGTALNFRHISDNDSYTEITYNNAFPTQIDVYTDSGKTHQINSTTITRVSGIVTQTTKSIYDIDTGTSVVSTFTTTINRVSGRVVSTTSVRT